MRYRPLALLLVTLGCVTACASAADQYRDASADCVLENNTRAEMDACRAAVRARFGLAPDGGAK